MAVETKLFIFMTELHFSFSKLSLWVTHDGYFTFAWVFFLLNYTEPQQEMILLWACSWELGFAKADSESAIPLAEDSIPPKEKVIRTQMLYFKYNISL